MKYSDRLETRRLTTRFLTQADVAPWISYCNDPIATAFTSVGSKTPKKMAQEWIDFCIKRYEENRFGLQALISKETGDFIGQCGLILQEVNGITEVEIGYHLFRRYWGKGYAIEAAEKFRDYGFENNVADSLVSIIHPQNIKSQKVAERNRMKLVDTKAVFRDKEYDLFRITKGEWDDLKTFHWSSFFIS